MIDTTKAKADAEEGLRIADKAHPEPWVFRDDERGSWVSARAFPESHEAHSSWDPCFIQVGPYSGPFIADSRTRAPEAYRNVIEMAGRLDVATSIIGRLNADRARMLADLVNLDAKVAAAELAEERMTRKAEEHYDRAVKAEAERDKLIAERNDLESRFAEVSADHREQRKRLVAMGVECDALREELRRTTDAHERLLKT